MLHAIGSSAAGNVVAASDMLQLSAPLQVVAD